MNTDEYVNNMLKIHVVFLNHLNRSSTGLLNDADQK